MFYYVIMYQNQLANHLIRLALKQQSLYYELEFHLLINSIFCFNGFI